MKQTQAGSQGQHDRGGPVDSLRVKGAVINPGFPGQDDAPVRADADLDLHIKRGTRRNEDLSESVYDNRRAQQSRDTDDRI